MLEMTFEEVYKKAKKILKNLDKINKQIPVLIKKIEMIGIAYKK